MYKTIFFDFNGTILQDVDLCYDLLQKMLVECNHPTITKTKYKEIFDFPVINYYKAAGFSFPPDDFSALSLEFIKEYQPKSFSCPLQDGCVEVLEYLRNKGYRLVCLSASQIDNLTEQLNKLGIIDYFDDVLGLDNIHAASKVEVGKKFVEDTNLNPSECFMIGDTTHDALVSQTLGFDCALLSAGHQAAHRLEKTGYKVVDSLLYLKDIL